MKPFFSAITQSNQSSKLRIAFVAHTKNAKVFRQDASFVYRCENLGLALQKAGHEVRWLHWTAIRPFDTFDVVVFHRPRYCTLWYAMFCWLKRSGCTLIADVDDLIFDTELVCYSPGVLNNLLSLEKIQQQFTANYRALACFEQITVSTQPLAQHIERCFPKTQWQVLPNAVHDSWKGLATQTVISPQPVITYFSGTRSHDRDFAVYAPALTQFLADNAEVQLHITGLLQFNLKARREQIVHHEKVAFAQYANLVQQAWLNLSPLEKTPFTECKSALKVIEAGFWNIPTLCSPFSDALRFESAGAVFAADEQSCFTALNALLNPEYYALISADLSTRVLAQASAEYSKQLFLQFIRVKTTHAL
jgi:hypothetical protein